MQTSPKSLVFSLIMFLIFGAICAFIIVPGFATHLWQMQLTDTPAEARAIGQTIVDYQLPEGYIEEGGSVFFGTSTVFIIPEDRTGLAIILMQFETNTNEEQFKEQIEGMFSQQRGSEDIAMTTVGETEATINGEPVTLNLMEGADDEGNEYQQVMGVFDAKNGQDTAVVMIRALVEEWDEDAYQTFIKSME